MDLTVGYRVRQGVPPLGGHELLAGATLTATLTYPDRHTEALAVKKDARTGRFSAPLTAAHAAANALELAYVVDLRHQGRSYRVLQVVQRFTVTRAAPAVPPSPAASPLVLTPAGWLAPRRGGGLVLRTVPLALHPLLAQDPAAGTTLTLDPLMLDITDLWTDVHGSTRFYKRRTFLSDPAKVSLRVLAHLGGRPYVWFAVVPVRARSASTLSPHVFYVPDDYGGVRYDPTSMAGLLAREHVETWTDASGNRQQSGAEILASFLLAPLPDDKVAAMVASEGAQTDPVKLRGINGLRAVTNISKLARTRRLPERLRPDYWSIPMGMEKALLETGVAQVLFLPQKHAGFSYERAQRSGLDDILQVAMRTLWTQSGAIGGDGSRPLVVDKLVLSGFSDSGVALWDAAAGNLARLRGIIGVEPQNMHGLDNAGGSTTGDAVIPKVVRAGAKVVIVGRHKAAQYNPTVPAEVRARIAFLPDDSSAPDKDGLSKMDYTTTFTYPPDVAANTWMLYRTYRLFAPAEDPFMDSLQLVLLGELGTAIRRAKKLPAGSTATLTHQEVVDGLFVPGLDDDSPGNFFLHNFAMSSGRKLTLPAKDPTTSYYGVAVDYRTFFSEAVAIVG